MSAPSRNTDDEDAKAKAMAKEYSHTGRENFLDSKQRATPALSMAAAASGTKRSDDAHRPDSSFSERRKFGSQGKDEIMDAMLEEQTSKAKRKRSAAAAAPGAVSVGGDDDQLNSIAEDSLAKEKGKRSAAASAPGAVSVKGVEGEDEELNALAEDSLKAKSKGKRTDEEEPLSGPGAVRIAGIDGSDEEYDEYEGLEKDEDYDGLGKKDAEDPKAPEGDAKDENLIHAFLVEDEPEVEKGMDEGPQVMTVDAEAVEYKPWYRRPPVMIALGLLLVAVIAIVLGVTLSQSNDSPSPPTAMPSVSPAPTALTSLTTVVQLTSTPQETGFRLVCDDITILDIPQGTYSFLPIGRLIPSFRVELESEVVVGSECFFTITDAGGDGLSGGFFEFFFGETRIDRGTLLDDESVTAFNATPPDIMEPEPTPNPAPTVTVPPTVQQCSICPDGSPIEDPLAEVKETGRSCDDFEEEARSIFTDNAQCKEEFQTQELGTECGCNNFCTTLCPDGSLVPQDSRDVEVRVGVTCASVERQIMARNSSVKDCNNANFLGESICGCPAVNDFCTICQDGTPQDPDREIVPGVRCGDISGIAYNLLRGDENFPIICPACLSIGEYCGCPPPPANPRSFCRMCGDRLLPIPEKIITGVDGINVTCFHVEFHANLGVFPNGTVNSDAAGIENCAEIQGLHSVECCNEG